MKKSRYLQDDLLSQTATALRRDVALEAELAERGGPPQPGDVYLFRATADLGLEWVVVATADDGRLLVVPVDTHGYVGSADLEISGAELGPLSLRFGHGLWLDATTFDPGLRSGALEPGDLARAQARQTELEAGKATASRRSREVDSDPEYRQWQATLAAARAALAPRPREVTGGAQPSRRWRAVERPLAMAASILLALTFGVAGGRYWERGKMAEERAAATEVPWTLLYRDTDRGDAEPMTVPAGTRWIALLLEQPPGEPEAGVHRLEIRRSSTRDVVWKSELEKRASAEETMILLPRALLPPGSYRLRLLAGSEERPIASYSLRIEWR